MQGGRPRVPRATELARRLVEENIAVVLAPYWRVLGFDVVVSDDGGLELRPRAEGGAKLYGESREGIVRVSRFEDLGAMVRVAELLQDRVFGRPKQAVEHTAPDGPILSALVMDPTIAEDARDLLRRAAAAQPKPVSD